MNKYLKIGLSLILTIAAIGVLIVVTKEGNLALLHPKGIIALKERNLIYTATALMSLVVIPVLILTFVIVWKYRAGSNARYTPDWDHNANLEALWWGIPCLIILILAVITWKSTHDLDPSKALATTTPPITIQVVALPWKWLFIYPEQHIATVNMVEFPKGTPVRFQITSDAPMNSFSIPELSGQIYAMPGMTTQLNLMATDTGNYPGMSANLSGTGFAGMKFTATSTTDADFSQWVRNVKLQEKSLTLDSYTTLAAPSSSVPVSYYGSVQDGLYNQVVMKYMTPQGKSQASPSPSMKNMNMEMQ